MTIRRMISADATAYQQVRLRALQEHPEAFGRSYDDEKKVPAADIAERIENGYPHRVSVGAFVSDKLVGMLGISFNQDEKRRHRASLGGMYVAPQQRGKGYGRALLDFALAHIRQQAGISIVIIAVTVGNLPARNLYRSVGFVTWGVEPAHIRIGNTDYDIEWMALQL